jgi:pSer/pThr/pTyr-binding forkhead associated (FHA) protein
MVYSTSSRISGQLAEPDPRRPGARLRVDGRTSVLGSGGAVLGRSREADVHIDDANVSRKHAEVRPSGASWTVRDLGSTNGVKVNGRRIQGAQSLRDGDTITLGTSEIVFQLERS